jgi:hypothetical protein
LERSLHCGSRAPLAALFPHSAGQVVRDRRPSRRALLLDYRGEDLVFRRRPRLLADAQTADALAHRRLLVVIVVVVVLEIVFIVHGICVGYEIGEDALRGCCERGH